MPTLSKRLFLASLLFSSGCATTGSLVHAPADAPANERQAVEAPLSIERSADIMPELARHVTPVGHTVEWERRADQAESPSNPVAASGTPSPAPPLAAAPRPKGTTPPVRETDRFAIAPSPAVIAARHLVLSNDLSSAAEAPRVMPPAIPAPKPEITEPQRQVAYRPESEVAMPPEPIMVPEVGPMVTEKARTMTADANVIQLNLPSVLASVDGRHPVVGFAQWQVQQAYAELSLAEALWLPSLRAGLGWHRHDGNYQASSGEIVDVNRNSFQYGLGVGATGAGTTQRPGLIAQFHLADAIFEPKVREKRAWASGHAAGATMNLQLRDAGIAYMNLVDAHQGQRIVEESKQRYASLAKITIDHAEAGEGLRSDADRLRTEVALAENRLEAARERTAIASARLAQTISLDASGEIVPMEINAVPLDMVTSGTDKGMLIGMALTSRPELKESQALVAVACESYRREKFAPFVPSVLLGFSTGGFGGGLGDTLEDVSGRYDFDALVSWQVRNLGFGERAARRQRSAQVQQARFEKLRVMDQVAREVSEAVAQVNHRQRQIEITRSAITTARESYDRNLERIRDGQGLPLEVLQSVQALESAQNAYLQAIVSFNQAQLQLQWALGWPVTASDASQG